MTEEELTRQYQEACKALEDAYQNNLIRLLNEIQAAQLAQTVGQV